MKPMLSRASTSVWAINQPRTPTANSSNSPSRTTSHQRPALPVGTSWWEVFCACPSMSFLAWESASMVFVPSARGGLVTLPGDLEECRGFPPARQVQGKRPKENEKARQGQAHCCGWDIWVLRKRGRTDPARGLGTFVTRLKRWGVMVEESVSYVDGVEGQPLGEFGLWHFSRGRASQWP